MVAQVLTWGGVLRDLRVPVAGEAPLCVVLGFDTFDPYPAHSPYFGAIIGRFANRIGGGVFTLNGTTHQLDRNEGGQGTLHGGGAGFSQRIWRVLDVQADAVTLGIVSEDGDQGFPGRLEATCRYSLDTDNRLTIDLVATTDQPTPVSLTQHSYFNLNGAGDICDHQLQIAADGYTPVGDRKIPTGQIVAVAGSPFDFRTLRPIGAEGAFDHNFVLHGADAASGLHPVAELVSYKSGLRLRMQSNQPGVQFYDGHMIKVPVIGLGGRHYGPRAGLCLEPQAFPDAPNQPAFPSAILHPGAVYHHRCQIDFDTVG